MRCPNFASWSFNLLPLLSCLSSSFSLPCTQAPNANPPSSLHILSLPALVPGYMLDRYESLPLSQTSLTLDLLPAGLFFSPLFQSSTVEADPPLTLFKSALSLLKPTSKVPSPCTFSDFLFPPTPSSSFLRSLNPSPRHPHPPTPLPSPCHHPLVSPQVNSVRCAAGGSSSPAAGRWWWRSRR